MWEHRGRVYGIAPGMILPLPHTCQNIHDTCTLVPPDSSEIYSKIPYTVFWGVGNHTNYTNLLPRSTEHKLYMPNENIYAESSAAN